MTRIRVAIVDDHPALREGTAALLDREADIEIVATVGSLAKIRALIDGGDAPDVVVQDIRLGDESGLRMLSGDRATGGRTAGSRPAIILWTAYDYPQYAAFAYRAGAAGFVVKTAPTAELVESIRRVAAGGLHFGSRPDLGTLPLSSREREVLEHIVNGRSNDEIGSELGVATRTVEAHLTRLFERYDVRSRTELATRAIRRAGSMCHRPPGESGTSVNAALSPRSRTWWIAIALVLGACPASPTETPLGMRADGLLGSLRCR